MAKSGPIEWGKPTGRPLAEPPMFNYDRLVREHKIGSDARLRRLFAKDIALGYRWRDAFTEYELSQLYEDWALDNRGAEEDDGRREFYEGLEKEIREDTIDEDLDINILEKALKDGVVTHLAVWEYLNLDEDGGTTDIKRRLTKGNDLFFDPEEGRIGVELDCREAFETYGHLAPRDFLAELKERFEEWYPPPSSEATSPGAEAEEPATLVNALPPLLPPSPQARLPPELPPLLSYLSSTGATQSMTDSRIAISDLIHSDSAPISSSFTAPQRTESPSAGVDHLRGRIAISDLLQNDPAPTPSGSAAPPGKQPTAEGASHPTRRSGIAISDLLHSDLALAPSASTTPQGPQPTPEHHLATETAEPKHRIAKPELPSSAAETAEKPQEDTGLAGPEIGRRAKEWKSQALASPRVGLWFLIIALFIWAYTGMSFRLVVGYEEKVFGETDYQRKRKFYVEF